MVDQELLSLLRPRVPVFDLRPRIVATVFRIGSLISAITRRGGAVQRLK